MIRPLATMGALAVLAVVAEADAYGADSYKKDGHYKPDSDEMSDYSHEPSYESHYAEDDYRERHHDSYDEGHYGGDAYSEEPSYTYKSRPTYKESHEPRSYRHKRSVSYGGDSYGKSYSTYSSYKP